MKSYPPLAEVPADVSIFRMTEKERPDLITIGIRTEDGREIEVYMELAMFAQAVTGLGSRPATLVRWCVP